MVAFRTLLCKKGFAKLPKVVTFYFIVSGDTTFEEAFLLFALFLSLDLVMILLFPQTMRFSKGATAFKLFIIAVFRDPICPG